MKKVFSIIGLVLLAALAVVPVSAQAAVPFTATVCRVGESTQVRIVVEATGSEAVLVQWVLDWNIYNDFQEGEFRIDPGRRAQTMIEVTDDTSQIAFFLMTDGGWMGIYEFTLDTATPPCGGDKGDHGPGCDQFMPLSANSVQITLASDTDLLWYPDESAGTGLQGLAGQTAWMIDSQDGYAEIVWACDLLWVDQVAIEPVSIQ